MSPCGRPSSTSAPAKPKPCSRPKAKATIHGLTIARLSWPRSMRTTSAATMTMLTAIIASTGRDGSVTHPSVAQVSVIECATVKAVIAFTSLRQSRTISISAGDEEQMVEAEGDVLDAVAHIGGEHGPGALRSRDRRRRFARRQPRRPAVAVGERDAHQRVGHGVLQARRSARSGRRAARACACARSAPSRRRSDARRSASPSRSCPRTAPSGPSRALPCIGVLNSTLNSFGASSWTLR